jgi:hypothetical protein
MDKLELVQIALRKLGDPSAAERIEPKFIPIAKASLRQKIRPEAARHAARAAPEQAKVEGEGPKHALLQAPVSVASPSA